jgi:hypothetical protein
MFTAVRSYLGVQLRTHLGIADLSSILRTGVTRVSTSSKCKKLLLVTPSAVTWLVLLIKRTTG